jgi:hypothetical protein
MKTGTFVFICLIALLISGCKKEDFNPVEGFQDKIAVMGILNNQNDIKFIKIQRTYNKVNSPNSEKQLNNLKVELLENNSIVYTFRDTTIEGVSNYSIYYNKMRTKKARYALVITDEKYPVVYATSFFPGNGGTATQAEKGLFITLSPGHYDYTFDYHIYIFYEQQTSEGWINKQYEVPVKITIPDNLKDTLIEYPEISKERREKVDTLTVNYANFDYAMSKIKESAGSESLKSFKYCVVFTTLDYNLYDYYFKGFNDKYSIRLDVPDWTNVINGDGVFGMVSMDTIKISDMLSKH